MVGEVPGVKAHLECRGLILSERGTILAIPELDARVGGVDLSHEAAVGKIAEAEIQYLMSRGLTSEEATAAIIRGFLDVEIRACRSISRQRSKRRSGWGRKRGSCKGCQVGVEPTISEVSGFASLYLTFRLQTE